MIPKVKNPSLTKDYRSISLCNVIYKLISKVLANWLKHLLPKIISQYQNAFIPDKLISDNIILAYKALHTMTTRQKGKEGSMALKLDIAKAYDRLYWKFLEGMLRKMGFKEKWISLLMTSVIAVKYVVLINGAPSRIIQPERGIR